MKVISSLRKQTKTGLSVWTFCYNPETKQHFAVGGQDLKAIPATSRKHLKEIYNSFLRYGYKAKLPAKKLFISDPWESQLPQQLQMELEALSA